MPSTIGIVASGLSTPLELSPALWLDAADTATITASSGSVSQWNDKSGNGYNVSQSNGANQPTTGTRTLNGLNTLDFDGTTDILQRASTSIVNQTDGLWTAFAVVVADTLSGTRHVLNADPGSPDPRPAQFLRFNGTTAESIRVENYSGTLAAATASKSSAASTGAACLMRATLDASNIRIATNGVAGSAVSSTGGTRPSAVNLDIGARFAANLVQTAFDGMICEIVTFDRALTSSEISLVETYLANKWGITL
jgi:hypothetical protein